MYVHSYTYITNLAIDKFPQVLNTIVLLVYIIIQYIHTSVLCIYTHVREMKKEGRKKQAIQGRTNNKLQGKATQHTQHVNVQYLCM